LHGCGLSLRAIAAKMAEEGMKLSHEGIKNVLAAVVVTADAA